MLVTTIIFCCLLSSVSAFFGSGCGCSPCGCQKCSPCSCPILRPIALPSLPSLCSLCNCFRPTCGCGRKKRSADVIQDAVLVRNENVCSNPKLKKIIQKNLSSDPTISKTAIYSEVKKQYDADFVVMCTSGVVSFTADSSQFCMDGNEHQTCYVIRT
ncbi:hypothetical protein AB6A40_010573 [Gnathostoma spinigerum]|uniref:Ground-like domain-containing protein n=1 Tax=Gnathostoma spinigerum TaxID=75299 RepID=A0ABD6EV73_9BILA